jgi:Glycosyltransferase Family 4
VNVALLHHGRGAPAVHELAASLRELGHDVTVLTRGPTALDAPLGRRGFTTPLTHLPLMLAALTRGSYDVAHAFSPQDAFAAHLWRRRSGRPVVLSLIEPIERERLADGRLRLRFLGIALEQSDAVIVHDDEGRAAAWRWLALEPPVIAPSDGEAHERLYRSLRNQT